MRITRVILLNIFLLLSVFRLSAFNPDAYLLRPFCPHGEFSSNSVNSIIQDKKGCFWVGTLEGLDRYDGYEVKHIPFPEECKGYDSVISLCEDDCGNVWVGSYNGIAVVNAASCKVRKYSSGSIQRILKSKDGNIWVAGQYAGFLRINPETMVCDTLNYEYHNASAHFGSGICYDGDDTMYFINGVGAIYRSGLHDDKLELILPYEDSPFKMLNIGRISYINGCIVGGVPQKTIIYRLSDGQTIYKPWSVLFDAQCIGGSEYVLATDGGIKVIDDSFNLLFDYSKSAGDIAPHDSYACCVCADDEGGLLFGTTSEALWRFNPNYSDWKVYEKIGEEDVHIRHLVAGNDGTIWIATKNNGLLYLDRDKKYLMRYPLQSRSDMLSVGFVDRYLMVGFNSVIDPMKAIDLSTGRVKEFSSAPSLPRCFFDQGEGRFLVGSSGKLSQMDFNKDESVRLEKVRTTATSVFEEFDRLWVSTMSSGLWSCKDGRWKHYTDSSGVSMTISEAVSGRNGIWLATRNCGLQFLDADTDRVKSVEVFGGVSCSRLDKLAFDDEGVLWITTPKGLASYVPESGESSFYTFRNDGIFDKTVAVSSIVKGADSLMYMGTNVGLVSFDPRKMLPAYNEQNRIIFTDFVIANMTVGEGRHRRQDYFKEQIDSLDVIRLRADENSFILGVSDMNYALPRTTSLAYMLEGNNDEWKNVTDGKIAITSLSYGSHVLRVCSTTRTGERLGNERQITIVVSRPVFASVVAILLYVILLVGVVVCIVLYFRRKALRDAEDAANIESERRDAENQKRLYASKIEFLLNIAHEIRTPLALVKAPIETLYTRLSDYEDKTVGEDLSIILHNSDILSNMLDELLDINKLENSGYELNVAEEDVAKLVENTCRRFSYAIRSKRLKFSLSLPGESVNAAVDKIAMEKIIGNLLYNAIKYSASSVAVRLEKNGEDFVVVIENDGQLVPLSERERIFLPFERYTSTEIKTTGTGIGLFVSRNLAQLHGGNLMMDTDMEVNRFILTIPISHMSRKSSDVTSIPQFRLSNEKATILIVEDNEDMRGFLSRQFENVYNVIEASDGEKAMNLLNLWTGSLPDAVISDVMMPGIDGYELCRRIKIDDKFCVIPVLLLTARNDLNSRVQGWEYGADAYISKPFSVSELLAQVKNIIENRRILHAKYLMGNESDTLQLSDVPSSPNTLFLKVLDDYVAKNIEKEDISVGDLASVSCMSESSLFKKMKGLLGIGPGEYILLARLKRASVLLRDPSVSISEISTRVGFRSHSTFSTAFRKQFGMSPKEYREKKNGITVK